MTEELFQRFIELEQPGATEARNVSSMQEDHREEANKDKHLQYGKLCLLYSWSAKDSANDQKIQELLDLKVWSRVKLPSKEQKELASKGYPPCAGFYYVESEKKHNDLHKEHGQLFKLVWDAFAFNRYTGNKQQGKRTTHNP